MFMSMGGTKAYAYEFSVKNADGVTIYYNYTNDGKELEVTFLASIYYNSYSGNVVIPEEVTYMNRTRKVTSIGDYAFYKCKSLTSVTIPSCVTSIGESAFSGCSSLTSFNIPNGVTSIGESAFSGCSSLTSFTIPNGVTSIEESAFAYCSSLTSVTIPNSVTSIGKGAFRFCDLSVVISLIENPFTIHGIALPDYRTFSQNTFNNATLFVPKGTIDKYKATEGWMDFLFIEEGTGGSGSTTPEKCEKTTISYANGKLSFASNTEGAICQYNITDTDIKSGSGHEVQLTVTYNISVYATKTDYENSETVQATLCWIDQQPKTEGITNGISQILARAIMIQSEDGILTIQGVDEGTTVAVYNVSGLMVGSTKANSNQVSLATNIKKGEVAIIKIGENSVKVLMQ